MGPSDELFVSGPWLRDGHGRSSRHSRPGNHDRSFILDVEQAPSADLQYFGYVEVWWRRAVSDPPATPTFGDVPASHPFYQFIEAFAKSGVTGGCGAGNFCPDTPLTRGQMAVFLSKALGLHWSN